MIKNDQRLERYWNRVRWEIDKSQSEQRTFAYREKTMQLDAEKGKKKFC
jgi:hypothetical protein